MNRNIVAMFCPVPIKVRQLFNEKLRVKKGRAVKKEKDSLPHMRFSSSTVQMQRLCLFQTVVINTHVQEETRSNG